MKLFTLILMTLLLTGVFALAGKSQIMVSIDKAHVAPEQIQDAIQALEKTATSTGLCFVQTRLDTYVDYYFAPTAPYYGVAILKMEWQCDDVAEKYLKEVNTDDRYTVYSNPKVGGHPIVSGSNNIQN